MISLYFLIFLVTIGSCILYYLSLFENPYHHQIIWSYLWGYIFSPDKNVPTSSHHHSTHSIDTPQRASLTKGPQSFRHSQSHPVGVNIHTLLLMYLTRYFLRHSAHSFVAGHIWLQVRRDACRLSPLSPAVFLNIK